MAYSQRDVVLVPFPFTDLSGSKNRPALIVSNSTVNRSSDVIVVMITTQNVDGVFKVELDNSHVDTDFKVHSSMNIHCKKIAVIQKNIITKCINKLTSDEKMEEILDKIKKNFDLN